MISYIMATSFSGRGSWSTRREPPNMGKQLVNVIICGCESSAPFFVFYNFENINNHEYLIHHYEIKVSVSVTCNRSVVFSGYNVPPFPPPIKLSTTIHVYTTELVFVLLSVFFWPLCCLTFFNLQIMITPLVSSYV